MYQNVSVVFTHDYLLGIERLALVSFNDKDSSASIYLFYAFVFMILIAGCRITIKQTLESGKMKGL